MGEEPFFFIIDDSDNMLLLSERYESDLAANRVICERADKFVRMHIDQSSIG
jgi:hypothetical protein